MGRRPPIRFPARGGARHRKTRGTRTGATRACRRKPRTSETARLTECHRDKSGDSPAGRLGPGTRKWPQGPHSNSARADARPRNLGTRSRSPNENGAKPLGKNAIYAPWMGGHAWTPQTKHSPKAASVSREKGPSNQRPAAPHEADTSARSPAEDTPAAGQVCGWFPGGRSGKPKIAQHSA